MAMLKALRLQGTGAEQESGHWLDWKENMLKFQKWHWGQVYKNVLTQHSRYSFYRDKAESFLEYRPWPHYKKQKDVVEIFWPESESRKDQSSYQSLSVWASISHFSVGLSFHCAKESKPVVLLDSFKKDPYMNTKWVIRIRKCSIINQTSMKKGVVKNRRGIIMSTLGKRSPILIDQSSCNLVKIWHYQRVTW